MEINKTVIVASRWFLFYLTYVDDARSKTNKIVVVVVLRSKLLGQETNSFAKELFITVCGGEMFLIQRIQDANWIPCSVYERPNRRGVDVLRRYGGTHRHYHLKFNFTSLDSFRVLMVLNAEYEVSCGILGTQ